MTKKWKSEKFNFMGLVLQFVCIERYIYRKLHKFVLEIELFLLEFLWPKEDGDNGNGKEYDIVL